MLIPLKFKPGIFTEASDLGAGEEGYWSDGNLVRFWKGQPQPIGGNQVVNNTNSILGVPRNALDWTTISGTEYVAIGTPVKLYVWNGNQFFDITPVRDSGTLGTDPFTTTSSSSIVSVADTTHGVSIDTYVRFGTSTGGPDIVAFNGVDMDGEWQVVGVTDADNFTVETNQTASGSGAGGGATADFEYDINAGPVDEEIGLGWGAGTWGRKTWGSAADTSQATIFPRTWSLSTWGEDLIANPRGGGIYTWDASVGTGTRATAISGAPATAQYVLVSPHTRHMIAFGAHDGTSDDTLFIRWSDQNDFTTWTSGETNQAGDHRVDDGSTIVSALLAPNGDVALWTDTAMYIMEYAGVPYTFNIRLVGSGNGIISPMARAAWSDFIWFQGYEKFFVYDGRVSTVPCDIETAIFDDINTFQRNKFHTSINREWEEVLFFSNSASSNEPDRYAAYNWRDGTWTKGNLARTTYNDRSEIFQQPYAFDSSGGMFTHEHATINVAGVFLESGALQFGRGDKFMFIDRILSDFERNTGTVNATIRTRQYPASAEVSKGPFALTSSTNKVDIRARGRQALVRLDSDTSVWRLSNLRLNARIDGGR